MPTVNDNATLFVDGTETDDSLHVKGLLNGVADAHSWLRNVVAANDGNKGKVIVAATNEAPAAAFPSNPTIGEALALAQAKAAEPNDVFKLSTLDGVTIEYDVYDNAGAIVLERTSDMRLHYPAGVGIGDVDPADFIDINDTFANTALANVRISLLDNTTGVRTGYHIDPNEAAPRTWTEQGVNYGGISQGGGGGDLKFEAAVLGAVPANTWTAFPVFPSITNVATYRVEDALGQDITDSFEYRESGTTYEIFSLLTVNNLKFEVSGT